jgi:hypothetical protein
MDSPALGAPATSNRIQGHVENAVLVALRKDGRDAHIRARTNIEHETPLAVIGSLR